MVTSKILPGRKSSIQRAHKDCTKQTSYTKQRSFHLLNIRAICTIFRRNLIQCIDGFTLLLQRYVRKGNDAKNPEILSFFFVTKSILDPRPFTYLTAREGSGELCAGVAKIWLC